MEEHTTISSRLPREVWWYIARHRAAMVVQGWWRRKRAYAHASRWPGLWPEVRGHLQSVGAWRELVPYDAVRREWRREAESWLDIDADDASVIRHEATQGLWGCKSKTLETIFLPRGTITTASSAEET